MVDETNQGNVYYHGSKLSSGIGNMRKSGWNSAYVLLTDNSKPIPGDDKKFYNTPTSSTVHHKDLAVPAELFLKSQFEDTTPDTESETINLSESDIKTSDHQGKPKITKSSYVDRPVQKRKVSTNTPKSKKKKKVLTKRLPDAF